MTLKRIEAVFYRTPAGREVVREWIRALPKRDRKAIGDELRRLEFRWPVGMPLSRPLGGGLHELRCRLPSERIARLIFFVSIDTELVVLHGFIKKTQATPAGDLDLARSRKLEYEEN